MDYEPSRDRKKIKKNKIMLRQANIEEEVTTHKVVESHPKARIDFPTLVFSAFQATKRAAVRCMPCHMCI